MPEPHHTELCRNRPANIPYHTATYRPVPHRAILYPNRSVLLSYNTVPFRNRAISLHRIVSYNNHRYHSHISFEVQYTASLAKRSTGPSPFLQRPRRQGPAHSISSRGTQPTKLSPIVAHPTQSKASTYLRFARCTQPLDRMGSHGCNQPVPRTVRTDVIRSHRPYLCIVHRTGQDLVCRFPAHRRRHAATGANKKTRLRRL